MSLGGVTKAADTKMQSDEEEDGWADVGELQEIDLSQLRSHKDQNGNVDKRNFGKGWFSSPQTPGSMQMFIVLSRFCLNCLFVFVREQNQRPGQKNGKSVCRKSSEETSRGRQRPTGEDGPGAGLHGETRSGTGDTPCMFTSHGDVCVLTDSTQTSTTTATGWSPYWRTSRKCRNQLRAPDQ